MLPAQSVAEIFQFSNLSLGIFSVYVFSCIFNLIIPFLATSPQPD